MVNQAAFPKVVEAGGVIKIGPRKIKLIGGGLAPDPKPQEAPAAAASGEEMDHE